MRAWRYSAGSESLMLDDMPVPETPAHHVLIDVAATGLCHTDVNHLRDGGVRLPFTPMTLGHEICGTVCSVGEGTDAWKPGDRVTVLANSNGPGSARNGGYAEKVLARADELVSVPDQVDDATAAVAADAGVTTYRAVMGEARVAAGSRVGIIGLGGLGMLGARLSVLAGADVYAADVKEHLFEHARDQGVHACSGSLEDFADRELDIVIDFAGMNTTSTAFKAVRPRGRVVQVGIGQKQAVIDLHDVLLKRFEYVGSVTGSRDDLAAFLTLVADGAVRPLIETIAFDEIGASLHRLARGEVTGRLVAVM